MTLDHPRSRHLSESHVFGYQAFDRSTSTLDKNELYIPAIFAKKTTVVGDPQRSHVPRNRTIGNSDLFQWGIWQFLRCIGGTNEKNHKSTDQSREPNRFLFGYGIHDFPQNSFHADSWPRRDMAALRLARIRSRERAKSPISSRDFGYSPDVCRSPFVILSATSVSRLIGRTIQWAMRNESIAPTIGTIAIIPIRGRRALWISFSMASPQNPTCMVPTCPSSTGTLVSYIGFSCNDNSRWVATRCLPTGSP